MTLDQFVDSICISIGDFSTRMKNRIKTLIPQSFQHILGKHQWEFTIVYDELTTSASDDWVDFPGDYDKEVVLWRADYEQELEYITPREYARQLAADATPYGTEACKYTVVGGGRIKHKRFFFLDKPTSALTIKGFFSKKIDPAAIQSIPDNFYEPIKSHVLYRITPRVIDVGGIKQPNPAFQTAYWDYRNNLTDLIAREGVQKGRLKKLRLDRTAQSAYSHFHK